MLGSLPDFCLIKERVPCVNQVPQKCGTGDLHHKTKASSVPWVTHQHSLQNAWLEEELQKCSVPFPHWWLRQMILGERVTKETLGDQKLEF